MADHILASSANMLDIIVVFHSCGLRERSSSQIGELNIIPTIPFKLYICRGLGFGIWGLGFGFCLKAL